MKQTTNAPTVDELAAFISIQLSANKRRAPILRGKATTRLQAEQHQAEFCRWVAERMLNSGNFTIAKATKVPLSMYDKA